MLIHQAFDRMLKELNIKAQDVCDISGVSKSRLSQFRSGRGGDIGVRSLDSLLEAANSINPDASKVFAKFLGSDSKTIDEMSIVEKGQLIVNLAKSIEKSALNDPESLKTA